MNNEESIPSFAELQELARQADRKRNTPRRVKAYPPTSSKDLVRLGGKPVGGVMIFGGEGQTVLTFKPSRLRRTTGWAVELTGKASREERKRVLSASGRGLWDRATDSADAVCKAAEGLIDCAEGRLAKTPAKVVEMQACLAAIYEALKAGKGKKLQVAFDLLASEEAWAGTGKVDMLQEHCLRLAATMQRPPSKKELKDAFEREGCLVDKSGFAELLRHAGLSWLKQEGRR